MNSQLAYSLAKNWLLSLVIALLVEIASAV
jgi:hypothetical protein